MAEERLKYKKYRALITSVTDVIRQPEMEVKPGEPPVPETLDPPRRDPSYFMKPRWKKLTDYELLLLYAQINPEWISGGLGWGDWVQKFPGGRDTWANYFTELRVNHDRTGWEYFRDPARRWQFPFVTEKGEEWRAKQRMLRAYIEDGQQRNFDPWWLNEIINKYYAAFLHHEYGLFSAHASPIRDCLSATIRMAFSTGSFDILDSAQMIQGERVFLKKYFPDLDESIAPVKQIWMTDPVYKGAREAVSTIWMDIYDHLEIMFTIYMIHEPLFGRFARRDFFNTMSPYFGDTLTPMFLSWTIRSQHVEKNWAFDLYDTVLAKDPQYGDYNKKVMQVWVDRWFPQTVKAIDDFGGMWDKLEGHQQAIPNLAKHRAERKRRIYEDWQAEYLNRLGLTCKELEKTAQAVK